MKNSLIFIFLIFSLICAQTDYIDRNEFNSNKRNFNGEPYISSDDGIVRMYINVIGHVKNPGTYLVYEGIDILTLLSISGGPLPGAKLNNVKQISNDKIINLNVEKYINSGQEFDFTLYPHDTIYVEQTKLSYLFRNSNLINSTVQILNMILILLKFN